MAQAARERFQSDYSLSTTGIAGPDGGTDAKPVGLVYIGLATPETLRAFKFVLPGDREKIRERTAVMALDLLRRHLIQSTD
jgi:nicotinamide-nucleotide amidase